MRFEDLNPEYKRLIYRWMHEGLFMNLEHAVKNQTYALFISAVNGKTEFTGQKLWESLRDRQKEHIDHVDKFAKMLRSAISELTTEIIRRQNNGGSE